jgi:predicted component of type VI protein secretion system
VRELEMIEGPAPGDVFQLDKEKTSLGAVAAEADIVITDPFRKISRRHCEINRSGKHYFLIDCSTNGTTVNEKPVPKGEAVLLKKGDRIGLAEEVVLRFR